jgi:hypothetical protein
VSSSSDELAGEGESQPFGAASNVAVLYARSQYVLVRWIRTAHLACWEEVVRTGEEAHGVERRGEDEDGGDEEGGIGCVSCGEYVLELRRGHEAEHDEEKEDANSPSLVPPLLPPPASTLAPLLPGIWHTVHRSHIIAWPSAGPTPCDNQPPIAHIHQHFEQPWRGLAGPEEVRTH